VNKNGWLLLVDEKEKKMLASFDDAIIHELFVVLL
jgi:hypothetical protein